MSSFPASSRFANGVMNGLPTDVQIVKFADKIVVTVVQEGRLAQWFHVPLDSAHRVLVDTKASEEDEEDNLLPLTHLTPTTLLGGTIPEREATGQLLAVQLASLISTRTSDENRMVVCGLGLQSPELNQQSFLEVMELLGSCL